MERSNNQAPYIPPGRLGCHPPPTLHFGRTKWRSRRAAVAPHGDSRSGTCSYTTGRPQSFRAVTETLARIWFGEACPQRPTCIGGATEQTYPASPGGRSMSGPMLHSSPLATRSLGLSIRSARLLGVDGADNGGVSTAARCFA